MGGDDIGPSSDSGFGLPAVRPDPSTRDELMRLELQAKLFASPDSATMYIGRYRLVRRLGRGGMGDVFLAEDEQLGRKVAIKIVRRDHMSPTAFQRLRDEASTLARLSHPNVITIYEVGEHEGQPFVVMEYVERGTLRELSLDPSVSRETLFELCLQAGAGLAAAHRAGVIHRDFKPANVLVDEHGRARVADFGLARPSREHDSQRNTTPGGRSSSDLTVTWAGTLGYVAPELFAGASPNERSDLFSYCVSVWEVLGGRRPFGADALRLAHQRQFLPRPTEFSDHAWKRRLLERGLAFDPRRRWPSVDALLLAFERKPRQRRRALAGASLAAVAAPLFVLWPAGPPRECLASEPEMAAWSPAVAAEIETIVAARSLPYADAAGHALVDALEHRRALAAEVRSQLCTDHYETGLLTASGFDAGLACLRQADHRVQVLIRALRERPDQALAHVDDLLAQLPAPSACRELATVAKQRGRLSETLADLIEDRALAEAWTEHALGRYQQAWSSAEGIAGRAQTSGRVRAEALLLAGASARALGEPRVARTLLLRSVQEALRSQAAKAEFEAALQLVELMVFEFQLTDEARLWLDTATASFEALGRPSSVSADFELATAALAGLDGRMDEAQAGILRAIELLESADASAREIDGARLRLANLLGEQNEHERALALYREILERQRARLGPGHPALGWIAFNIGVTLHEHDHWADARACLTLALEHLEGAFGSQSTHLASILTLLGSAEVELGEAERAIALAERAWAIQQELLPPTHEEYGSALVVLGYAQSMHEDFEGALATYQLILEELELDELGRAGNRQTQAWLLARLGRWQAAAAQASSALLTTDERTWRRARFTLAEVELRVGDPAVALRDIEQLRAAEPLDPVDQGLNAELAWLAALAGRALGRDPGAAEAAAREAWAMRDRLTAGQRSELMDSFPSIVEPTRQQQLDKR